MAHRCEDGVLLQLDDIQSQQVDAPEADVSNEDDVAILEEEIKELRLVVRSSQRHVWSMHWLSFMHNCSVLAAASDPQASQHCTPFP